MPPSVPRDPYAIERELRKRLTETQYRVLQARLTGAVKAIATLRDTAPDLLPLMFGKTLDQAKTLPVHTQSALTILVDELLLAAACDSKGQFDRKRLLRLVKRLS
jgi:hypothetical protein